MQMFVRLFSGVVALGCWMAVSPVQAQKVDNSFRIGMGAQVVRYSDLSRTISDGFGRHDEFSTKEAAGGLGLQGVGLELGFVFADIFEVGASVGVDSSSRRVTSDGDAIGEYLATQFSASLSLGVLLAPESMARPFVGIRPGIQYADLSNRADASALWRDSPSEQGSATLGTIGPVAGIRVFLARQFSLFLQGNLDYVGALDGKKLSGLSLGVSLGLSGWLGGQAGAGEPPDRAPPSHIRRLTPDS